MKRYGTLHDLIEHVRWYIKLRWAYIACLSVAWLGGNLLFLGWNHAILHDIYLMFFGIFLNLGFYLLARRNVKSPAYYYYLAVALLLSDIVTASIVLYEHGGFEARTIILYGIPIFIAGALFGRKTLIFTIAAAAFAYDFTVALHAGIHHTLATFKGDVLLLITFYNTVFIIFGLVAKRSLDKTTESLTKQNDELTAFNKAKDEFVSIASHQLRTPATAVKQYIGMMQQGYGGKLSKTQLEMLEKANESNERQLKIVSDLLQIARIDAGRLKLKRRQYDMAQLVSEVIEEQRPEFDRRRQHVIINAPARPAKAAVDAQLMRMAVENIINNASKYSLEGKSVEIELKPHADRVDIVISDQGVGLSEREQKLLFQKFSRINSTLSDAVGGSGLGLYWAKKVVDLHGGQINIASKKRRGSTFTITVPVKTSRKVVTAR
jgi:signal transduction histidine kinase